MKWSSLKNYKIDFEKFIFLVKEKRKKITIASAIAIGLAGTGYCLYRYQNRMADQLQRLSKYASSMERWDVMNKYRTELFVTRIEMAAKGISLDAGALKVQFKPIQDALGELGPKTVDSFRTAAEAAGFSLDEAYDHLRLIRVPSWPTKPGLPKLPSLGLEVVLPSLTLWVPVGSGIVLSLKSSE
jgi:hypothetical protein